VVAKTTYLYQYAKSQGTKITYFTSDSAGFSHSVDNEVIEKLKLSNFLNWLKILFFLLFKRPDHVELYFSRIYFETFPTVIFCLLLRIPLSLVSRGKDLRDHKEHKFIRQILTKFICRRCSLILPKEDSHVQILKTFKLSQKTEVHQIHNGVPVHEFNENKFGIEGKTFLFLNAFRELRNLDMLIKAFSKLKDDYSEVHLFLVGSSLETNFLPQEKNHELMLLELISDLGLQNEITIHPFSSDPWTNIKDILAFVLPADQVWLNNALLEAMSYSIPPIIIEAPRAQDIIFSGRTGVISSRDINSLYLAMKSFIEEPQLAKSMGINARKKVQESFSAEKVSKEIFELYEKYLWRR
jgi:glycosyltransferase involved in cell wall biosynthesis